jgi:ABC-2 type transport system ATP-binding protein
MMGDRFALEARGLSKRFGGHRAVDGLDLAMVEGSVYGLLGRNGAGKTTLLRIVLGLLSPDSGSLRLFGQASAVGEMAARDAVAGFVDEPRFYPYLSAQRNLELFARLDGSGSRGRMAPEAALELVDLLDRRGDKVGNFSTGMRQRLGVASALLRAPRLLVLDEPSIGLDPASAASVRSLVRDLADRGVGVLLSSHNMAEVDEVCDSVTIMHEGRTVWQGTQADLRAAAPAPAYRVWTTDDALATTLAWQRALLVEPVRRRPGKSTLTIRGEDADRDVYLIELHRLGVAVRQLEPDVPPLESLFASLTTPEATDEKSEDAA